MVRNFFLLVTLLFLAFPALADDYKSAYDRIMKTQTIRCAYNVYAPYFMKDPNTGAFSGIFYDLVEEVGKNSGLKIEWTEEVSFDEIFAGLMSRRYDAHCSGMWPNLDRVKVGTFSIPVAYSVVTAWGRYDEKRFKKISEFDDASVKISTIDGEMSDNIARTSFPLAQRVSSPLKSAFTDHFLKITTRKADVVFAEPSLVKEYIEQNPKTLKQLTAEPLRIFGNTIAISKGEYELKELIDVALQELIYNGRVDAIIKKHEKYPGSFISVAKPYEAP